MSYSNWIGERCNEDRIKFSSFNLFYQCNNKCYYDGYSRSQLLLYSERQADRL